MNAYIHNNKQFNGRGVLAYANTFYCQLITWSYCGFNWFYLWKKIEESERKESHRREEMVDKSAFKVNSVLTDVLAWF